MKHGLAGWLMILFAPAAAAGSAEPALKQFVDGVQTLSAHFEQVQRDEHGGELERTSGRMWLQRPAAGGNGSGKFRWAYEKPYRQLMVCDGARIWIYDPDLAQVTVRPAGQALAGTPAELLSRRSTLGEQFKIEDAGQRGDARVVRLKPKSDEGDFKAIELTLRGPVPTRMVFYDQLGGSSEVRFSEVQVNGKLDGKLFEFKPPKGAEVVGAGSGDRQR